MPYKDPRKQRDAMRKINREYRARKKLQEEARKQVAVKIQEILNDETLPHTQKGLKILELYGSLAPKPNVEPPEVTGFEKDHRVKVSVSQGKRDGKT